MKKTRTISLDIKHAKSRCVMCGLFLERNKYSYEEYGNFCRECTTQCNTLANYYPGPRPEYAEDNEKIDRWERLNERYTNMSEIFQKGIVNKFK